MKKLGLFMSAQPKYIESTAPLIETTVGSAFTNRVVPVKSLLDGGIRTVLGTDEHVPNVVFLNMGRLVTRKAKVGTTEKVLNPEERIDRMTALLMATRWAAEYVLREDVLGSLEPGKWADLVVIDRDFLSIPDDEIRNTKVLLTAVGGKIVYTEPVFAQAEGLPQIGHRPR
jgi:predicted amidohydrolase YtcJ